MQRKGKVGGIERRTNQADWHLVRACGEKGLMIPVGGLTKGRRRRAMAAFMSTLLALLSNEPLC